MISLSFGVSDDPPPDSVPPWLGETKVGVLVWLGTGPPEDGFGDPLPDSVGDADSLPDSVGSPDWGEPLPPPDAEVGTGGGGDPALLFWKIRIEISTARAAISSMSSQDTRIDTHPARS
jgi:hypothetical protein